MEREKVRWEKKRKKKSENVGLVLFEEKSVDIQAEDEYKRGQLIDELWIKR